MAKSTQEVLNENIHIKENTLSIHQDQGFSLIKYLLCVIEINF